MTPNQIGSLISEIGVYVQLGGTALLLVLFFLLSRHAGTRPYFSRWTQAWFALLVALLAVMVRYLLAGPDVPLHPPPPTVAFTLSHGAYFLAKLVFLRLLLDGCLMFTRNRRVPGPAWAWYAAIGVLAVAGAWRAPDLNRVMLIQEPIAVAAYGYAAWLFLGLPRPRRTLGVRCTGLVFAGLSALWVLYAFSFWAGIPRPQSEAVIARLAANNSFLDAGSMLLLAFGMVVILLEDSQRDVEQARVDQLRAVAESEARLKAVIETATDGIVAVNAQGEVVLANAGAARLLGGKRREMLGRRLTDLLPPEAAATLDRRLVDVHRSTPGRQAVFEVQQKGADGREMPLEIAASTHRAEAALLDIFVLRDVSDRRRNEEERAELQARLAQSLRMEALGRLVSGVAHELNNPLAAILTFSEQLLAERPPEDKAGPLGTIREQARRARMVVRDLLTFVRRREERRAPAEMATLVERTVRALENDFARQGVRLRVTMPPGLPTIVCDGTALEQVLTNLLDNAARATPGGEVVLTVVREGEGIRVTVEDDGPGIPEQHFPRLFEPFFTTRGTGEGTGLGLPVSLGIIEQHGGVLRAENRTPGPGARFLAWLPLGVASAEISRPKLAAGGRVEGPPGHVLLVDDEAPVRASLRRYFQRQGWTVAEAADGREAIERMERTSAAEFDLVICDLKMPGVSGLDVHQWIRTHRAELLPRLVFASGDTATPETAEFLASNECAVLEKPFELADLAATVTRVRTSGVHSA